MLDGLQQLIWVDELGSFTAAARRAHLSQPALTASIQRLEEQFGDRLFDRGPSGATLTGAGRALLPWAKAALAAIDRGRRSVDELRGLRAGEIRLAASSTACAVLLPAPLTAFRAAHPGLRLTLREAVADDVVRSVDAGALDLGIVSGAGTEPWRDDALVLVAAPGVEAHALPHLAFPVGTQHRAALDRAFPGVEIAMELSSVTAVRNHVAAGMGVALLSLASVAAELERGELVRVDDPRTPIPRTLSLVHLGLDRLSPAARALRDHLVGEVAAAPGPSPGITLQDGAPIDPEQLAELFRAVGFARNVDRDQLTRLVEGARWVASAWHGPRLVGFVRVLSDGVDNAYVSTVAVHPDYQRRGLGTALMRRVMAGRDAIKFVLHTSVAGRALYASLGFVEAEDMRVRPRA